LPLSSTSKSRSISTATILELSVCSSAISLQLLCLDKSSSASFRSNRLQRSNSGNSDSLINK
jgi:hypothetical protein